jgi:hypothetical protein
MHSNRAVAIFALAASSFFMSLPALASDVPRHLELARELLAHIQPEDNHYSLGEAIVTFPGDLFASRYAVRADCSGFLLALFNRAQYGIASKMIFLNNFGRRHRHAAEDFVLSIEQEKGFKRVLQVAAIQPGDLIAHRMLQAEDKQQTGTTGHIFLVNSAARPIAARPPEVAGTRQYEIAVIDSNREYVGSDDTRLADPAHKISGVGGGTIRLYADAESGELVGWARTFKNTSKFFSYSSRFPSDTKLRVGVIGRPAAGD